MSDKNIHNILIILFLLIASANAQYNFQDAFPNLPDFNKSLDLQNSGDCTNRIFVVEQDGIIKVFENKADADAVKVFIDITDRVDSGEYEMGLLGLAFHPDYINNGYFYVNYTAGDPRRTVISRFSISETNPDSADIESEFEILSYIQPFGNHNGGWISFGHEDGYLYISSGDGGPHSNGQMNDILLGKILRINVDKQDPGLNYSIPPDNPFIDSTGNVRKEIYATGLRNPWRCSFDHVTGWFWCGDVGAASREEIDIIINGGNYGWACYEGNLPWVPGECPDSTLLVFPVYDYPRTEGLSISGGHVYRGPNQPELEGKYIYADWGSRKVWSLQYDGVNPAVNELLFTLPAGAMPTSFGTDEANELYICAGSRIYKIEPTASVIAPANLTAFVNQSSIVELNWTDNSDNEDGFSIERMSFNKGFEVIATLPSNTTFYEDTISETAEYKYRVNAFSSNDTSGYSNIACVSVKIVSVENNLTIESNYHLHQNYPNPFNPFTNIRFYIPEESRIKIEIINILGEVIHKLSDNIRQSGFYNEIWNADSFSSGIYYVRMKAESLISDKSYFQAIKMIYLK